jgi:hypothetical protein
VNTAPSVEFQPDAGETTTTQRIKGTIDNIRNEIDKAKENVGSPHNNNR